ncbi:MAG: DEAD/DEAH box helicase [Desulfosarcina sp.]|nr:DEAD/DEAH box helicase [Desulfosarcina sp.]MBC2742211.1 DEAD/DEAH box helicase [Desulfosarcina sp.]MBC2765123.1 DEAD/DEAH box helicase [Desulfosarcina sp.]
MTEQDLIAVLMPDGGLQLEWDKADGVLSKSRGLLQNELYQLFESENERWLLSLGFSDTDVQLSASLSYWRDFAALFTQKLIRTPDLESLREKICCDLAPEEIEAWLNRAPMMTGLDYLDTALLERIWATLHAAWRSVMSAHDGTVAAFIKTCSPKAHLVGRIFFHLVENKDEVHPFAFLSTYSTRLNQEGDSRHVPLKFALQEFAGNKAKLLELLATVHEAAKTSAVLGEILSSGGIFQPLAWSAGQAYLFLKDIPVFEKAGILCRIPNWWKAGGPRISLDLQFGAQKLSFVGMEAILSFNAGLLLDGEPLTKAEVQRLLAQSEGLAFIKNKWVAVDPDNLQKTLAAYEEAEKMMAGGGLSWLDAMRLQMTPGKLLGDATFPLDDVCVSHGKWLSDVMQKLRKPQTLQNIQPNRNFKARLRKYQQTGLNWLCFLHSLHLGACLADDMGLGKTVQVLAFLNCLYASKESRKTRKPSSLLVIPASLLANWAAEIRRFYPELSFFIAHPGMHSSGELAGGNKNLIKAHDLVITTYALAGRYRFLQNHSWYYLILDEAQAIKNPGTKQTKVLKTYKARNKLILTGTPIENRLSDLWSLFDFINPGLLGSAGEFKKVAKDLNQDHSKYGQLRKLIRPYILRRLKTDRTVIRDLPAKVEMKTYTDLAPKQIVLYQQMVSGLEKALAVKDGMQRKGLILSSLMKLKQLCNHPDQYLGGNGYQEAESGKFSRLREICRTIHEKRERVLVFTQFKEIIDPLCHFLAGIFHHQGLFIHGSVPVRKRKVVLSEFQGEKYVPYMVLSLKAGGVGLNLTRANHVIHFDRWWNPAVENQATDRAFRIGQKKNVLVHKFITNGTVEEKIDLMIEEKKRLSQDVIAAGNEDWITEMDNEQVMDLFRLSLPEP